MGTSKSSRGQTRWIAGALIFSGHPDPTWPAPQSVVDRLEDIWDTLPPSSQLVPNAPALGYRGCFLREEGDREWFAYGGVVRLEAGRPELREDRERRFEKTVLASAPAGRLPPGLV